MNQEDIQKAWNAGVPPMWPQQKEGETFSVAYIAQPEQQAEPPPEWPLIKNILAEYGLDAISFVAEWKAAQQQTEGQEHMKHEKTFDAIGKLKDIELELHRLKNALEMANKGLDAQRPWVDLTDGDWEWVADKKETSLDTFAQGAVWAADQLKEKNT